MEFAMTRLALAATLAASLTVPALAQTATEYYVVQDTSTKKCTVVEQEADHHDLGSGRPNGI